MHLSSGSFHGDIAYAGSARTSAMTFFFFGHPEVTQCNNHMAPSSVVWSWPPIQHDPAVVLLSTVGVIAQGFFVIFGASVARGYKLITASLPNGSKHKRRQMTAFVFVALLILIHC